MKLRKGQNELTEWYYFEGPDGRILGNITFDDVWLDETAKLAKVYVDGKGFNFFTEEGKFISDTWFDDAELFNDGFAVVYLDGKGYNFLDKEGKILSDKWFQSAYGFKGGFGVVEYNDGLFYINREGKLIERKQ